LRAIETIAAEKKGGLDFVAGRKLRDNLPSDPRVVQSYRNGFVNTAKLFGVDLSADEDLAVCMPVCLQTIICDAGECGSHERMPTVTDAPEQATTTTTKGSVQFTALKPADDTLVPQAAQIVAILQESGGTLSKQDLLERLKDRLPSSRQPMGRILSFYKGTLTQKGFIQVQKA
jgi:hypothetical protein